MCRKLALAATAVFALTATSALAAEASRAPEPAKAPRPTKIVKASKVEREMAERLAPMARASFWADQVAADPADADAGLKLASSLRALGEWQRAGEAAEDVSIRHPENEEAFLDLARAYLGKGSGFYAIVPLKKAQALNARDWRPVALLGVAYEQIGREDEAEAAYSQAMGLSPNNPAVMANLALFRFGQGRAAEAEAMLRRAASLPGATQQTRQNLAFVLGRQGRFDEAEALMRQDLPPEAVANNIGYLKAAVQKAEAVQGPVPAAAAAPAARTYDALKSDAG